VQARFLFRDVIKVSNALFEKKKICELLFPAVQGELLDVNKSEDGHTNLPMVFSLLNPIGLRGLNN
jgi:hypothetical protein